MCTVLGHKPKAAAGTHHVTNMNFCPCLVLILAELLWEENTGDEALKGSRACVHVGCIKKVRALKHVLLERALQLGHASSSWDPTTVDKEGALQNPGLSICSTVTQPPKDPHLHA